MKKLTPRQKRFVAEYLIDLNAKQAAIRSGYSAKTAEQQGPRLLGYAGIRDLIEASRKKQQERLERTADDIVRDIREIAAQARRSGDLRNALKGLELEGKRLGMFESRVRLGGDVSIRIVSEFPDAR
jgi:phage terminase small subunit